MNVIKIKDTHGCFSALNAATSDAPEPLTTEKPARAQTIRDNWAVVMASFLDLIAG